MPDSAPFRDWVPAALAKAVGIESTVRTYIHAQDIVLWRGADGIIRAWENRCPHRGMRLSFGAVRGNTLTCLYHGWTYGADGVCTAIPAHPGLAPPRSLCVTSYACAEAGGLVWVCTNTEASTPPIIPGDWVSCRSVSINVPVTLAQVLADLPASQLVPINAHAATVQLPDGANAILAVQTVDGMSAMVHCSLPVGASLRMMEAASNSLVDLRSALEVRLPKPQPPAPAVARPIDAFTANQWYAIGREEDFAVGESCSLCLLSEDLEVQQNGEGMRITGPDSRPLPVQTRYGHVWTTLGDDPHDLYDIPEFDDPDRRLILIGAVGVRCSGLRAVENFLDMAHFPFVHTGILGAEDRPEVEEYDVSMEAGGTEVWATRCRFFQPAAAATAKAGQMVEYRYRVAHPYSTILYKSCPVREREWDLIGLFIQPTEEDACLIHSFVLVYDDDSTDTDILHFQQAIFLQDRIILENQVPGTLPIDPRREMPTRADASSIAYRRWLKTHGVTWGIARMPEISP